VCGPSGLKRISIRQLEQINKSILVDEKSERCLRTQLPMLSSDMLNVDTLGEVKAIGRSVSDGMRLDSVGRQSQATNPHKRVESTLEALERFQAGKR
jgi:hypothetical protein